MKKGFFLFVAILSCVVFSGCVKTSPTVFTINPSLTATIGTYDFISSRTVPSILYSQHANLDTGKTLIITGYTSDPVSPRDRIVLTVTNYTGVNNTYSIVEGQASATYYHGSSVGYALGGIVSIQKVTTTTITGYFSFNTQDNLAISNGLFTVGLP